jgi:GNAT superfamily N-acetyltransferase
VSHPLDKPVLSSLTGAHAGFAERRGKVLRYQVDVSPFLAMPDEPDASDWADAAWLAGPGGLLPLADVSVPPPADWEVFVVGEGVQMTGERLAVAVDEEAVPLGRADVPEMLDLTARTQPGPFLPRTFELGTYLGIRRDGRLVAMAGERLHPEGWTEISAVCTDEPWRGQGLASRLVRAVGAGIRARGEIPFLHAVATNPAIALYEQLGFRLRRKTSFSAARIPETLLPRRAGHRRVMPGRSRQSPSRSRLNKTDRISWDRGSGVRPPEVPPGPQRPPDPRRPRRRAAAQRVCRQPTRRPQRARRRRRRRRVSGEQAAGNGSSTGSSAALRSRSAASPQACCGANAPR